MTIAKITYAMALNPIQSMATCHHIIHNFTSSHAHLPRPSSSPHLTDSLFTTTLMSHHLPHRPRPTTSNPSLPSSPSSDHLGTSLTFFNFMASLCSISP